MPKKKVSKKVKKAAKKAPKKVTKKKVAKVENVITLEEQAKINEAAIIKARNPRAGM